jgi:uncharacterized protein YktA (UPF0223 family)
MLVSTEEISKLIILKHKISRIFTKDIDSEINKEDAMKLIKEILESKCND